MCLALPFYRIDKFGVRNSQRFIAKPLAVILSETKQLNKMNTRFIFLLILMNFVVITLNAQITIRENSIVEKPAFRPKQFDSLTNIVMQNHPTDYKKYIGYKLFFLPKSKNYKPKFASEKKDRIIGFLYSNDTIQITKDGKIPFEQIYLSKTYGDPTKLKGERLKQYNERKTKYDNIDKEETNIYQPHFYHERTGKSDGKIIGNIGTLPDSVEGKYFTIIDIKGKEPRGLKEYKKLDDVDLEDDENWLLGLKILLRNETNKDTLYWIVEQARFIGEPFFLVPYFEKQRSMYLNQTLVLKDKTRTNIELEKLIDVNTGAIVKIKYGEVWTCSDISFINSKESYFLKGFCFLKNGDREVKVELGSEVISDYFILETELKKQELEKQKKEEERKLEEQEREKKEQQEKNKFKKDCIAKWGQKLGGFIVDGKVVLGMNKEMCIAAWGNPIDINRTIVYGLISEQWVFGWGTYLYFDNEELSAIQD